MTLYSRAIRSTAFFLFSSLLLALSACEGGKSASTDLCNDDHPGREPYMHCAPPQTACPIGQTRHNGTCVATGAGCGIGYHEVNGACVPNTLTCETGQHQQGDRCVADQLTVEIVQQSACWHPGNGATELILQLITRDQSGLALSPDVDASGVPQSLVSEIFIEGRPLDVESVIRRDSELLRSDLIVSLVLDATYSMLQHNPPAFEPMKTAAIQALEDLQDTWRSNGAAFHWELAWFDQVVYRPQPNLRNEHWGIQDIAALPSPTQGQFTGLYKAVNAMVGVHRDLHTLGVAANPRDQHIMIVFSDGDDNHSYFDNSGIQGEGHIDNRLFWEYFGSPATRIDDIGRSLAELPQLRIHVIGFGDLIDATGRQSLQSLAERSGGQFFYGSSASGLDRLFDSVKRELVTLQTLGAQIPLPPDARYSVAVRSKHLASGAEGQHLFNLSPGQLEHCNTAP